MDVLHENKLEIEKIVNMDATGIAKSIANGETTSLEVVQTYINHLEKINPSINAIVEERYTIAVMEAVKADKQMKDDGPNGPLHGVPISVKESFDVEGMKTTGGLIHLKNNVVTKHAHVIEKLIKAGAIIICKTNTPSLCFCQETENKLYGRTNNPWDTTLTAGGSSGGEGALLGAGGAAAGIGSDIGGSIRVPSHFNGVVGFKSGKHQVVPDGHLPRNSISLQERMASFGPMGKTIRDMKLIYEIITETKLPSQSLEETQIDILQGDVPYPLSTTTSDLLDQIESFLSKSHTTKRSIPPLFEDSSLLWQEIMSIDGGKDIEKIAFPNKGSNVFINYIQEKVTKQTETHSYLSWALIGSKVFKPSAKRVQEIQKIIEQGDIKLSEYLHNRLLIFPVYHTGAQKHGKVYKEIFSIKKTFRKYMPFLAYANVWGLPAVTIPVGVDNNELPISIQIIGQNGNEDRIFQLGEILETEYRGYVRCTTLD